MSVNDVVVNMKLDTTQFEEGLRRATAAIQEFSKAIEAIPKPPTLQDLFDLKASIDEMAREEPARG